MQSCKNVPTVPTSWCYFFWPVLIFGKSTRKTGKKQHFFGANFFCGKNWSVLIFTPIATMMLSSFCLCCLVIAQEHIISSSPPRLSSSRWGCGCQSGPWFRSTLSVSWVLWFCSFPILLSKMFVSLNFLRKSLMATFIKPGRRGSRCDNPQWKRGWSDLGNSWEKLLFKVFIFYLISSFLSLRTPIILKMDLAMMLWQSTMER